MKNGTKIADEFCHTYSNLEFMGIRKNCVLFEKITQNAANLFVKGGDIISRNPLVFGSHEVDTEELIKSYRINGYNNFLLDIGANIGMTSCLTGNGFEKIFCYEPNPQVYRILQTNIEITFGIDHEVMLNNFGLGEGNNQLELTIPKNNYGGAFIRQGNTYSNDILLDKDNITDPSNAYDYINVSIKDAKAHLNELFLNNIQLGSKGVIKIDVEGYEPYILKAIAETLPFENACAIIFENHDPDINSNELKEYFNRDTSLYCMRHYPVRSVFKDKLLLKIKSFLGAKGHYKLNKLEGEEDRKGQLLIVVEKK